MTDKLDSKIIRSVTAHHLPTRTANALAIRPRLRRGGLGIYRRVYHPGREIPLIYGGAAPTFQGKKVKFRIVRAAKNPLAGLRKHDPHVYIRAVS